MLLTRPEQKPDGGPGVGPAAEAHGWPDGLRAQIVSVMDLPQRDPGSGLNDAVRITVEFTNTGDDAVAVAADWALSYGHGRSAGVYEGFRQVPGEVAPGATARATMTSLIPWHQVGLLRLRLVPAGHDSWTFTDLDRMMIHR